MAGTPPGAPRPMARDADRERLIAALREHYARGELELDDLSRRVGIVLAATYTDEAAAALTGLSQLTLSESVTPRNGPTGPARRRERRGHAEAAAPAVGWVPTDERFRDPTTRVVMRVWVDPADLSRHYVPDEES
jgi:Domain of unknown function (DUF1707)